MIDTFYIIAKLCLAAIIGLVIGRERKRNDKPIGARTFAIICLSSCLLAIISLELSNRGYIFDFVRLISYSLPAIGFLGMGLIHKTSEGVEGLTTASTLFILLPIGFSIGFGLFLYGIISSILLYLLLESKNLFLK